MLVGHATSIEIDAHAAILHCIHSIPHSTYPIVSPNRISEHDKVQYIEEANVLTGEN